MIVLKHIQDWFTSREYYYYLPMSWMLSSAVATVLVSSVMLFETPLIWVASLNSPASKFAASETDVVAAVALVFFPFVFSAQFSWELLRLRRIPDMDLQTRKNWNWNWKMKEIAWTILPAQTGGNHMLNSYWAVVNDGGIETRQGRQSRQLSCWLLHKQILFISTCTFFTVSNLCFRILTHVTKVSERSWAICTHRSVIRNYWN